MPFTPFHAAIGAFISLSLEKYFDPFVFVFASVALDLETLIVRLFGLDYSPHGYAHTLLFGALVGAAWGALAYWGRGIITWIMHFLGLRYAPRLRTMVYAGVASAWVHVILDAIRHPDVEPFFPFDANPFYEPSFAPYLYLAALIAFVGAFIIYAVKVQRRLKE